jgi:hypothetical protein
MAEKNQSKILKLNTSSVFKITNRLKHKTSNDGFKDVFQYLYLFNIVNITPIKCLITCDLYESS